MSASKRVLSRPRRSRSALMEKLELCVKGTPNGQSTYVPGKIGLTTGPSIPIEVQSSRPYASSPIFFNSSSYTSAVCYCVAVFCQTKLGSYLHTFVLKRSSSCSVLSRLGKGGPLDPARNIDTVTPTTPEVTVGPSYSLCMPQRCPSINGACFR